MGRKLSSKEKLIYADMLNTLSSEYSNIFIKDRRDRQREYSSYLEGIFIALLTNYIISFLFQFNVVYYPIILPIQTVLFVISISIIIYLFVRIIKKNKELERDVREFDELKKINWSKFIGVIEKDKGYKYTKKLLPYMVYHYEKNIRVKR